jgi:acetyl-CoA carboxylase biotin carboxylase subunit
MNTRIQVEHAITEVATGIDLVAEQLRIAQGEPLSIAQQDVAPRGAAIELRLNAENPAKGFLPSPGTVDAVRWPSGPWVRVDAWLEPGGEVPPYYDSLVGKLIVWGGDRTTAIRRARRALGELEVEGIHTTAPLLAEILGEDWFAEADFHTATLEAWLSEGAKA